jgi:adenosylhomocysteine nucleosidase
MIVFLRNPSFSHLQRVTCDEGRFPVNGPGIVVAMVSEAKTLTKAPWAPGELIHLPGGGILNIAGIGARRAEGAARALLARGVTGLMSWGTAGGLVPGLSPGSLVLPETILRLDRSHCKVDETWRRSLWTQVEGSVDLHGGILGESSRVLMTPQDKELFFSRTGAVTVDMESGAIAAVASDAKIPFIAIRAISDAFDSVLPFTVLKSFDKFGRLDKVGLVRELTRHPQDIPRWLKLIWELRSARKTLTLVAPLIKSPLEAG